MSRRTRELAVTTYTKVEYEACDYCDREADPATASVWQSGVPTHWYIVLTPEARAECASSGARWPSLTYCSVRCLQAGTERIGRAIAA